MLGSERIDCVRHLHGVEVAREKCEGDERKYSLYLHGSALRGLVRGLSAVIYLQFRM